MAQQYRLHRIPLVEIIFYVYANNTDHHTYPERLPLVRRFR